MAPRSFALAGLTLAFALASSGCGLGLAPPTDHCLAHDDCNSGRLCNAEQRCVDPDAMCDDKHPCVLYAASPLVVKAGDTMQLEGRFATGTTVTFVGAVNPIVVPITHVGNHAHVIVPTDARSGTLRLHSGHFDLDGPEIRVTSFTPAIAPTHARPDSTIVLRAPSHLANARRGFASVATGTRWFVFGGQTSDGTIVRSVESARLDRDGHFGAFVPKDDCKLDTPRAYAATVHVGSQLIFFGGFGTDGGPLASSEAYRLDGNVTTGFGVPLGGITLREARGDATAIVIGDSIYVLGGRNADGAALATIERFPLGSNGLPTSVQPSKSALLHARVGAVAVVRDDAVYVLGGVDANGPVAMIERAPIADGQLGAFVDAGITLAVPRAHAMVALLGDSTYLVGGDDGGATASDVIERVPLGEASGASERLSIGLLQPRAAGGAIVVGNTLLLAGGANGSNALANVERLALDANVDLHKADPDDVTPAELALPTIDASGAVVVLGNYLHLFGGRNDAFTARRVQLRTSVDLDGRLRQWMMISNVLSAARWGHRLLVTGDKLWVIGGEANGGFLPIEWATIGDDGDVQGFHTIADEGQTEPHLVTPRSQFYATVVGDSLYLFGGNGVTGRLGDIERASVTNDNLGSFTVVPGFALENARRGGATFTLGSDAYLVGGSIQDNSSTTRIERASFDANGALTSLVDLTPQKLNQTRTAFYPAIVGGNAYLFGGAHGEFLDNIEEIQIADATLTQFSNPSVKLQRARAYAPVAAIGNFVYVMGGYGQEDVGGVLTEVYLNVIDRFLLADR